MAQTGVTPPAPFEKRFLKEAMGKISETYKEEKGGGHRDRTTPALMLHDLKSFKV